jgi:hypothetical protein
MPGQSFSPRRVLLHPGADYQDSVAPTPELSGDLSGWIHLEWDMPLWLIDVEERRREI